MKGKLANGVGSQYLHTTSEHGVSSITTADAHTSAASIRLNGRPCRLKWTRTFRRKTKYGFCACATTFQTQSNAGYTMFRSSVKGIGYPLHSPVSPSLPLLFVTVCHQVSTGLYCRQTTLSLVLNELNPRCHILRVFPTI